MVHSHVILLFNWWFCIAMLVYQMVHGTSRKKCELTKTNGDFMRLCSPFSIKHGVFFLPEKTRMFCRVLGIFGEDSEMLLILCFFFHILERTLMFHQATCPMTWGIFKHLAVPLSRADHHSEKEMINMVNCLENHPPKMAVSFRIVAELWPNFHPIIQLHTITSWYDVIVWHLPLQIPHYYPLLILHHIPCLISPLYTVLIWRFPEMGVSPVIILFNGIFPKIKHPAIGSTPFSRNHLNPINHC